jgi:uncharacterized protein YsxB (DUF464 family)
MTKIKGIYNNERLIGFDISGHANYSIPGRDIVCAAVSILTINTINSIRELTCMEVETSEDESGMRYHIPLKTGTISSALLKSARIGYKSLADQYPDNVSYIERR